MTYRTTLTTLAVVPILSLFLSSPSIAAEIDLDLEPAISSEISANGLYAFDRDRDSPMLEPAINGEVSANGLFANQAEQDAYTAEQRRSDKDAS